MKIKQIHISNYRAFLVNGDNETGRYVIDLPAGENLLIYGENGSGKSSLYKAMRDFFGSASNEGVVFRKNLFYDEQHNTESPFIEITFDNNSQHRFSADGNQYIVVHEDPGVDSRASIVQANVSNGFISYRDLLRLYLRGDDLDSDLYSFFLGEDGLFAEMIVPSPKDAANKISFSDLWGKIQQYGNAKDFEDYNLNAVEQFQQLEEKANLLLKYFQQECSLKIDCIEGEEKDGKFLPPKISLKVALFDVEIPEHEDVLNEARLTALAISIYLSHVLSLPDTDLKLLFLDDIFIGLDMTNRIPLLRILCAPDLGDGTSFEDFQIFLTTYDREWFNVAGTYLNKDWGKVELYVDDHGYSKQRPLIRASATYRQRAEYHLIEGDYPASANYLRKAFEQSLRRILPDNVLYPGFASVSGENSTIAISKRQMMMSANDEAWFFKFKEEDTEISSFKFISLGQMITQFKGLIDQYGLPFLLIEEFISIKNRLLNPLSHDDLRSSVFKAELLTGFKIYDEMEKIDSRIILPITDLDAYQLHCVLKDYKNDLYYYRFELKENLRVLKYGTFKTFLNAQFTSQYRAKGYQNFEVNEKDYPSLKKLCEGVFFLSKGPDPDAVSGFYENFVFDEVFTDDNRSLSQIIQDGEPGVQ